MHIDELETPVPVVDMDRMQANITRLQNYLDEHKIANRPHIKTHKIPAIARMQVDAGAVGITCQKVSEAEIMVDAGFTDIFLPYNILGESKLRRLMALARRVTLSVTADSAVIVRGLSRAAVEAGLTLPVLIECDTGAHRCGVQSPQEAAELARLIDKLPNLQFDGLMTAMVARSPVFGGTLKSFKAGRMTVIAGGKEVKCEVAENVKIRVATSDLAFAQLGDKVEVEGWYYTNNKNAGLWATEVSITAANPLEGDKKKVKTTDDEPSDKAKKTEDKEK